METFLVQVWVPADDLSRGGDLRGMVRHVATGTETAFLGDEQILDVLRQSARPIAGTPPDQTKENDR